MNIEKIVLNSPSISLYLMEEQGLLFNSYSRTLYHITPLVITFVLAIDEGLNKSEAINEISTVNAIPVFELLKYYNEAETLLSEKVTSINYSDGLYPEALGVNEPTVVNKQVELRVYSTGDTIFSLDCKNKYLYRELIKLLKPIEGVGAFAHFNIEIKEIVGGTSPPRFRLFCNNLLVEKNLLLNEVIPLVIDRMQILTFQHSNYYFCFHGAALKTSNYILLLPGKSGAGKSTLSATLASDQYELYSDEMIALDKHFVPKVLKLPIAIKSGSWHALLKEYPELAHEKEYSRLDGRRLKYVWPASFANSKIDKICVKERVLICNPSFTKSPVKELDVLKPLTVIETLIMLVEGGYQVGVELDEEKLDTLLYFLVDTSSYQLSYTSSLQAKAGLAKLMRLGDD